MPKIGAKVIYQGKTGKLMSFFEETAYIRLKYAREEEMVAIDDLEFVKSDKPESLTRKQRGEILTRLVEHDSIMQNFKQEIVLLSQLIKKYPSNEFWLEGFKPALKVDSLKYWYHHPDMQKLYQSWSINLTTTKNNVSIGETKMVEDIETAPAKPKNLLDII